MRLTLRPRLNPPLSPMPRLRWMGLCLLSLGILFLLGLSLYLVRRHAMVGGALLLAVHLSGQLTSERALTLHLRLELVTLPG